MAVASNTVRYCSFFKKWPHFKKWFCYFISLDVRFLSAYMNGLYSQLSCAQLQNISLRWTNWNWYPSTYYFAGSPLQGCMKKIHTMFYTGNVIILQWLCTLYQADLTSLLDSQTEIKPQNLRMSSSKYSPWCHLLPAGAQATKSLCGFKALCIDTELLWVSERMQKPGTRHILILWPSISYLNENSEW